MHASADAPSCLTILAEQLRLPLTVENVHEQHFPRTNVVEEEVVPTNRLICLQKGELQYTVERRVTRVMAGQMVYVPAWSRRGWQSQECRMLWCEFRAEGAANQLQSLYISSASASSPAPGTLRHMLRTWGKAGRAARTPETALLLEGALKSLLAMFWVAAQPAEPWVRARVFEQPHPRLGAALSWLAGNYGHPEAVGLARAQTGLSASQFRHVFQKALLCPPTPYILRLRMRHARYLLETGTRPIKQIAAEVGYEDALYFTRRFTEFWGQPPSAVRGGG